MVKYIDNNSGFRQWNAARDASAPKSRLAGILWWIILFLASWWLLSWWMTPAQNTKTDAASADIEHADLSAVPVSEIRSDDITADIQGLRISNIELLKYAADPADASGATPVALLATDGAFAEVGLIAAGTTAPTAETVWTRDGDVYTWQNSDGVKFTRTITIDGYVISVADTVHNASGTEINITPYGRIVRANDMESSAGVYTGSVAYIDSDIEREDWSRIAKSHLRILRQMDSWVLLISIGKRYCHWTALIKQCAFVRLAICSKQMPPQHRLLLRLAILQQ